jgi:hypothetical protein
VRSSFFRVVREREKSVNKVTAVSSLSATGVSLLLCGKVWYGEWVNNTPLRKDVYMMRYGMNDTDDIVDDRASFNINLPRRP